MCLESFFFLLQTSRTFDIDTREKNPTLRIFYPVGSTFIRLVFPLRPRVCLCCILNRSRNEEKVMKGNPLGNNFSLEGERWRRLAAQQCSVRKKSFCFLQRKKSDLLAKFIDRLLFLSKTHKTEMDEVSTRPWLGRRRNSRSARLLLSIFSFYRSSYT